MIGLTEREVELMAKYQFNADEVEILNLAEKYATRVQMMLFENEGLDDDLEDLTAEVLTADDFLKNLDDSTDDGLQRLEEVKDLLQKLMMAQLQIMLTRLFATGDIR